MESFLQDLRYGLRSLAKSPTFSVIAVLTLALGVGVNTAIFSFVDALWLRPIPVPDSARLVRVYTSGGSAGQEIAREDSSYPDYIDLRAQAQSFAALAALERRGALLDTGTETLPLMADVVSDNFFSAMQVRPERGRAFTESDARSQLRGVLLSNGFWSRQFNRDSGLVGRTIVLDNQQVVVLGILPRGFRMSDSTTPPDIWIPVSTWDFLVSGDARRLTARGRRTFEIYGRLYPRVDLRTANAELQTIAARLAQAYPETNTGHKITADMESSTDGEWNAHIGSLLLGIGLMVLLIACANVSSLFLARADRRRKEIATRLAIGGTRLRLARQLLTESLALTTVGLAAAAVAATWLLDFLRSIVPAAAWLSSVEAQIDGRALVFACAAATVCLMLSGIVPAFQCTKIQVVDALKDTGTPREGQAYLRKFIVVAQVALSLVMIVCTGLLVRTVMKTESIDPGFGSQRNVAILEVVPSFARNSDEMLHSYLKEARRVLDETPGVVNTSFALRVPLADHGGGRTTPMFSERELATIDSQGLPILMTMVGDNYFETMGTRLISGRSFESRDIDSKAPVVIVNQSLAKMLWPGEAAIGKHVRLGKRDSREYEIVGVAEDGKYNELIENPGPYFFTPLTNELGEYDFIVNARSDADSLLPLLRQRLRSVDPSVPLTLSISLRDHLRNAIQSKLLAARLVSILGCMGLLLSAIGLYGLLSFLVGSRTREIGIRMALGAEPKVVFRAVVWRALLLTAVGILVGSLLAAAGATAIRRLLYGVTPLDWPTFAIASVVLVVTAAVAAFGPALRATRVDVMEALRHE